MSLYCPLFLRLNLSFTLLLLLSISLGLYYYYLPQNVVSDGILMDQGFEMRKSKGIVEISPPGARSDWYSLSLDPDGGAYIEENLLRRPPIVSIFSMRDAPISMDIWHARLGHCSYSYLVAIQRFPQYAEAGFNIAASKLRSQECEHCLLAKSNKASFSPSLVY